MVVTGTNPVGFQRTTAEGRPEAALLLAAFPQEAVQIILEEACVFSKRAKTWTAECLDRCCARSLAVSLRSDDLWRRGDEQGLDVRKYEALAAPACRRERKLSVADKSLGPTVMEHPNPKLRDWRTKFQAGIRTGQRTLRLRRGARAVAPGS